MAGHRYWRVNIIANNGHGYAQFSEIAMASSVGGANLLTGGTPIASGSYSSDTSPDKALDGNQATVWCGGANNPVWWGYDFGAGNTPSIYEVRLTANSSDNTYSPSNFTLDWSDDGSTWEAVQRWTPSPWASGTAKSFPRPIPSITNDPNGRRYWRVYITADDYGPNQYAGIDELQLRAVAGGSTLTGDGQSIRSGVFDNTTLAAFAFDGSTASGWSGGQTIPSWLGYDFGPGVTPLIAEIQISDNPSDSTDSAHTKPSTFTIDCSPDGTTWTTLSTYSGVHWNPGDIKTFSVAAPAVVTPPAPPASTLDSIVCVIT